MRGTRFYALSAVLVFVTMTVISSCDKAKTAPVECPNVISFSATIEPMIQANCSTSGCHDAGTASSGHNLEGHLNISGNSEAILNVIRHESGVTPMPYFQPKLNDAMIKEFDCWVEQGKLNN